MSSFSSPPWSPVWPPSWSLAAAAIFVGQVRRFERGVEELRAERCPW